MSEPTSTLQELRREICKELKMPFYQRFPDGSVMTGTPTTLKFNDANLIQQDGFWKRSWIYIVDGDAAGDSRMVTDFQASDESVYPEYAFSATPAVGAAYELLSIFSATDIHGAINRAIDDGYPSFFDVVMDETIVIKEDTIQYSLTSLSTSVWRVLRIWLERATTSITGVVDSATSTTLIDSELIGNLGDVDTNWDISIYDGTGAGQLRDVSSVDDSTGEVTVTAWTTDPDSTSKYRLWNPSDQKYPWAPLTSVQFDTVEHPNTLYLYRNYPDFYGLRMRIQYLGKPSTLSTEAGTTVVPKEFIIKHALSQLAGRLVRENKVDRTLWASVQEYARQEFERYRLNHAFEPPSGTLWSDHDLSPMGSVPSHEDPMGWGS